MTERALENLRQRIASRPVFNLKSAFKYVDRDSNGAITYDDMRDMMAAHGFFGTDKELQLVMNKFDKFSETKITMTDFLEELEPRTSFRRGEACCK